jgi:hypothetical protein
MKNKTLEAWLGGYVLFRVNGQYFPTCNTALENRLGLEAYTDDDIDFEGWHIFKGWRLFYRRGKRDDVLRTENNR